MRHSLGGRELTIACIGETLPSVVGAFRVAALRADCLLDTRLRQVVAICLRRVRVVARCPDVVDVKVRDTTEGAFDVLVADVVRVTAVGVCKGGVAGRKGRGALLVVSVEVGLVVGGADELAEGIIVGEIDVGLIGGQSLGIKKGLLGLQYLLLECGIEPAVVDAQSD